MTTRTGIRKPSSPSRYDQCEIDWSVLDDNRVRKVAENAAKAVSRRYAGITETDDLYQEALLLLAQSPKTIHEYGADLGRLYRWLWCDLTNLARRWAVQRNREVSCEMLRWGAE